MIALVLAASLTALPATLPAQLARARPGDTITLAPGDYGRVAIQGQNYAAPGIVIRGDGARLLISFNRSSGIELRGGTLTGASGAGQLGYAANILDSSRILLSGITITDSRRGIVINRSQDVTATKLTLSRLRSDGINIAESQRVTVRDVTCRDFAPKAGDHPDCIQGWSRPGGITADVLVTGVDAAGDMQGIFFGNHVRKGIDDGGFDRVRIVGNRVVSPFGNGIGVYACRACDVTDNEVSTLKGAKMQARVSVMGGSARVQRNKVGSKR